MMAALTGAAIKNLRPGKENNVDAEQARKHRTNSAAKQDEGLAAGT
jgi:hypothetical protein